jgi:spore coat protein U-like protein
MKTLLSRAALAAAAMAFGLSGAYAATPASNTLSVKLAVIQSCTVDPSTLDFGPTTAVGTVDASATISVSCGANTSYNIYLSLGSNPSSGSRRMSDGASFIRYDLYATQEKNSPLSFNQAIPGYGSGSTTIYGRAYVSGATPGEYADTVTISVNY